MTECAYYSLRHPKFGWATGVLPPDCLVHVAEDGRITVITHSLVMDNFAFMAKFKGGGEVYERSDERDPNGRVILKKRVAA